MKKLLILIMVAIMTISLTAPILANEKTINTESYNEGKEISGDCLVQDVTLSDDLKGKMAVTNSGLELIDQNFQISVAYPIKSFAVINDIDNDGINDLAVYLKTSTGYSNFQIISAKSSEVLYEQKLTHFTADENGNKVEQNSLVRQIISNDNLVYLIYDYHLLALDPSKKEVVFDHQEKDNLWKMVIVDNQIIFTNQLGELVSIDKSTGSENYRQVLAPTIQVTQNYNKDNKQDITLNLWDILVQDNNLYVSSEADKIYKVDAASGEILKELELNVIDLETIKERMSQQFSYNYALNRMMLNSTGVFSRAFNGYKLKMLKDNLMLVEVCLGDHDFTTIGEFSDAAGNKGIKPTLVLVDTTDFSVKLKIDLEQYNLTNSNALLSTYQNQEVLLLPSYTNNGSLKIFVYSLENGKLVTQTDLKGVGVNNDNSNVAISHYKNEYLIQIGEGNSFVLQNDLKTINYLGSSKIINKISDLSDGMLVSNNQDGKINEILKLGLKGKDDILMRAVVPTSYRNNGFEAINYDASTNQILSLVNETNDKNEIIASHLVIVNLNDGSIILDKKVLLEKGTDENNKYFEHYLIGNEINYFNDLNNDGKREILVDNSIIDGSSFTFKSNYSQEIEEGGTVMVVGDLNNDGVTDLVNVGEAEMRIYYSNKNGFDITYQKSNVTKKYDKALANSQSVKSIGDLEHNGVSLFVINARNDQGCQYYQVINPKDLSVRFNLMETGVFNWGESIAITNVDYNQDGCDDLIFNGPDGKKQILSGKDGNEIAHIKQMDSDDDNDITTTPMEEVFTINIDNSAQLLYQLEDMNGDGIRELGFIYYANESNSYEVITKFKILDGKNLEELKVCDLSSMTLNDQIVIPIQGQTKVIFKDKEFNQIYDYQNDTLVAGTELDAGEARALDNERILIETTGGQLYIFNDQTDFSLVDFEQEKFTTGNINVKYNSDKRGMISVYDQGSLIGQTTGKEIALKLLQGEHRLVFSYNDGHGKVTHLTKQITVAKSSISRYLVILISLLVILMSVGIVFYPKYRLYKKAGVKNG